jgi:bleomycin hydrolase
MKKVVSMRIAALLMAMVLSAGISVFSQEEKKEESKYLFKAIVKAETTPVISQASTSTCWCFATTSMIESEIIRLGGPVTDLSEMYTVRNVYQDKADKYVRLHGATSFPPGGAQHDVTSSILKHGIVPQEVYPGLEYGEDAHRHGELHSVLNGMVENIIKNRNGKLTPVWKEAFSAVLDVYLGANPQTFTYKGKEYTPASFAESLPVNPDDYVEISSYTHHAFYQKFELEVPDNWMHKSMYNVPIDELMEVIEYALNKGITISWAADISGLNFGTGVATIPEEGADIQDPAHKEKYVSQNDRQELFDNYNLTDDHAMHLVGLAEDQNGKIYFIEKNSWGTGNPYEGFSYLSDSFMRLRTMSIMVHKDGIPAGIMKKLQ